MLTTAYRKPYPAIYLWDFVKRWVAQKSTMRSLSLRADRFSNDSPHRCIHTCPCTVLVLLVVIENHPHGLAQQVLRRTPMRSVCLVKAVSGGDWQVWTTYRATLFPSLPRLPSNAYAQVQDQRL